MTAIKTENVPRYSSTARKLQRLRANAIHSNNHSVATNGISQPDVPCIVSAHGAGRFLAAFKTMPFHRRKLYFILLQVSYQLNLFRIETKAGRRVEGSFVVQFRRKQRAAELGGVVNWFVGNLAVCRHCLNCSDAFLSDCQLFSGAVVIPIQVADDAVAFTR